MQKTVAIIVTYNPDREVLRISIRSLETQVDHIIIIDNASHQYMVDQVSCGDCSILTVIELSSNMGLAAAQNLGISEAKNLGATHVMLLDQDSIVSEGMLAKLHEASSLIKKRGVCKIGAIGPLLRDQSLQHVSKHRCFGAFGVGHCECDANSDVVKVDYLIASGSLIEIATLDQVGGMEEGFFIDHIDTEWTLRAASKGFYSWGHCTAIMDHSMGYERRRIWFGRWRNIPIHSPSRYYYVFRNGIAMHARSYVDRRWKKLDILRMIQYIIVIIILHPDRYESIRMVIRGVRDGIQKKSGPLRL